MGKRLYFSDSELFMLLRCVDNVDTADYGSDEEDKKLLDKLHYKVAKAMWNKEERK